MACYPETLLLSVHPLKLWKNKGSVAVEELNSSTAHLISAFLDDCGKLTY